MPFLFRFPIGVLLVATLFADARADESGVTFFEQRIQPLFAEHCLKCHGEDEQEGKLRLDQLHALLDPANKQHVIAPGKPGASLLVTAVRYIDAELQMPPDERLSKQQIADLVYWIEIGAPHLPGPKIPVGEPAIKNDARPATDHWAFAPPRLPPLPASANSAWITSPIDAFILTKLEEAGLQPAPVADRRQLIRRATFDLTGLPPTLDEVAAFLADKSPQAFARVVERLLASPRYGERWGRHWLDVARFADSNGLDENVAHGTAWRYRDWVIESLNRDLPYDEFLHAQIAGDLLPNDDPRLRNSRLIATGFLALGPKVLAEVDETKMEMDIIDEQIDTLGRTVLGLTLSCARCHDHKFDPISTRDYYALAGVFKSTKTMESFAKIAKWNENSLHDASFEQALKEHQQQLATKNHALETMLADATALLQEDLGQGAALPANPEESFPPATRALLDKQREEIAKLVATTPSPPTAMGVCEADPTDVSLHIRGNHLTLGDVVPRGVPAILAVRDAVTVGSQQSGRLAMARWLTNSSHPLTARVMVNRLWRWHFGRGLVETVDNFGQLGSEPSHPELLDWLALRFIDDGWSIKQMHREIMLSSSYQMSSRPSGEALRVDPENRLLSRFSARRLEAEEIRDAMLAVAGVLDVTMGGTLLQTENRKHIFDHTSKDDTTYATTRRSVYLPVVRNHVHDAFALFDYTDASVPNGNRNTSTVASQALYLLNSETVSAAATSCAERLLAMPDETDEARIDRFYQLALTRAATESEKERAVRFLQRFADQSAPEKGSQVATVPIHEAWRLLCHTILISNEFFYVP